MAEVRVGIRSISRQMMKITILAVGRLQERYWQEACAEYGKRLARYCALQVIEVRDEKAPENASDADRAGILKTEGERLLAKLDPSAPLWTLEIRGKRMDSEGFARALEQSAVQGISHLQFAIGGSLGLDRAVSERAAVKLSFSDMTFPHQLMRVILSEQIYRAFRIMRGEPYHK